MNRWSALAMRKPGWENQFDSGDIHLEHLTKDEAHGTGLALFSTAGTYRGTSPDPNDRIFTTSGPPNKLHNAGLYEVLCWCERNVVILPQNQIGTTTLSCGLLGCEPGGKPLKCEHCGQPLKLKDRDIGDPRNKPKRGRPKGSKRYCSPECSTKASHNYKAKRGKKYKPGMGKFRWLTETEQYDLEIQRLRDEIGQLQGEGT
jgi:hypothetical protein